MTRHQVVTFSPSLPIQTPHFYILSRGINTGRPMKESCPNCFVVTAKNEEEAENLFWIAHVLWKKNFWHQHLIGSVVLFIRIGMFKQLFRDEVLKAYKQHQKHLDFVNRIQQLEALQNHYTKTVEQIEKLKWALLQNQLR